MWFRTKQMVLGDVKKKSVWIKIVSDILTDN